MIDFAVITDLSILGGVIRTVWLLSSMKTKIEAIEKKVASHAEEIVKLKAKIQLFKI